jgi:ubiquinone/menaquinone biosynthesis C-methylase UbiE
LPFEDNQYDVILCNHVQRTYSDDTKTMQELYRLLKPGGMAILQIPKIYQERLFTDDTITDQKERSKILVNTIRTYLWTRLF